MTPSDGETAAPTGKHAGAEEEYPAGFVVALAVAAAVAVVVVVIAAVVFAPPSLARRIASPRPSPRELRSRRTAVKPSA